MPDSPEHAGSAADLQAWLARIERLHPRTIELGLDRVRRVAAAMDLRTAPCPTVIVAGTNGKGSSVAMLESIYAAAGYRAACYTSPHLLRYSERVRVDGREASDAALCEAFERVERARGGVQLTYFEFGTLAALDLFARAAPDVMILEVGLGGRLDAVNLVDADVALVTNVGLDHEEWLGRGREAIAREKAGVFRAGRPAVCADPDAPRAVLEVARQCGAALHLIGRDFAHGRVDGTSGWWWRGPRGRRQELPPPGVAGAFQFGNAAGVLMVVDLLAARLPVADDALASGLAAVRIPGRFQRLPADSSGEVERILDVAHNADGARALAAALAAEPPRGRTLAVFGVLGDKDADGMVSSMAPLVHGWYVAAPATGRAASAGQIATAVARRAGGSTLHVCNDVPDAWRLALRHALPGDRVLAFGSFYTVAEVLQAERQVSRDMESAP